MSEPKPGLDEITDYVPIEAFDAFANDLYRASRRGFDALPYRS